jgi:periplasmic divalent cation tolerance protein
MKFIVVKTTFDNKEEAEKMAMELLNQKFISCAQLSEIHSMYHWKGKIEKSHEFILL